MRNTKRRETHNGKSLPPKWEHSAVVIDALCLVELNIHFGKRYTTLIIELNKKCVNFIGIRNAWLYHYYIFSIISELS